MKPCVLDLFCGAGGAAKGYADAGFAVVGVDSAPQPHYPYPFIQSDALEVLADSTFLRSFDMVRASPPCQHYTQQLNNHPDVREAHPDLLPLVRARLREVCQFWEIENVEGAPMGSALILCGSMFGRVVGDSGLRRHRQFETSHLLFAPAPCSCRAYRSIQVVGHAGGKQNFTTDRAQAVMGIDWMNKRELVQAIPPCFTAYIGNQFKELALW